MPRIPPNLLESIKRDVSCVGVLEARGHVFQPHGGDVVTRCPFHDDRTPSLVVHAGKNLWHCFGACGVGGDVIALAQKLHGVSFRHAVELLASGLPAGAAGSTFAAGAAPPSRTSRALLPCPLDAAADPARLFQQVVDFYAQRLREPGNAGRAYLASRGLDDGELLRRFAFGYADRTLGLRLPAKGWKAGAALRGKLADLGLYRGSGHEHFAGSVVVPIHGDDGTVVGMYGRKVTANLRAGTPSHTYLPGRHRGIWNSGPGLVDGNGAVVVCEALLDAASFWVAGVRHVTAAYGVNGWTDDHWRALGEGSARDVFVAFDADAAGDAAAATLADGLIGRGFTAYRVAFSAGCDANDVLRGEDGPAALRAALARAQWLGGTPRVAVPALPVMAGGEPAAKTMDGAASASGAVAAADSTFAAAAPALPAGVTIATVGDDLAVLIGTRRYRVRGLARNRAADVLKVNLRLGVDTAGGERFHVDTLDLYQTRLRQAFTAAAVAETGLDHDLIKADLGKLLLTLECQQQEHRRREATAAAGTHAAAPAEMPDDQRAAALALLRAPDLTARIQADLSRCGLVGEAINKLVAYIATTSRRLDSPLAVVVQSSSAAGKSTLMDKVLSLMPPEDVRQYSAISGKSPFYLGTANLKHRILAVAEEEGARRASYALKLLQSDGFLSMAATGKDPQSGKLVTHDYRVEGPVMLMLTTTAIDVDPELLNRCLVLTVDEEPAQTAAIQASQRDGRTLAGLEAKRERAAIETLHRNAQRLLRPVAVVNPHAPALTFAAGQTRLRRDHAKYLALIDAVAFLHQHQRETKRHVFADGAALDYIEVTPEDIAVADELARAVLGRSLDDLPPQTRRLWEALRAFVAAEAARQGIAVERVRVTRRAVQAGLSVSYQQVRVHLDRLADHEYIVATGGGFGQVVQYRLVEDGAAGPGPLPAAGAPAPVSPPSPTTASLFASEGVCSSSVALGGTNGVDGEHRESAPIPASLFAAAVHDRGGISGGPSYRDHADAAAVAPIVMVG